jgi:hypothetical protein
MMTTTTMIAGRAVAATAEAVAEPLFPSGVAPKASQPLTCPSAGNAPAPEQQGRPYGLLSDSLSRL